MTKHVLFILWMCGVVFMVGCGKKGDLVVAKVAGRKITLSEVEAAAGKLPALRSKGIDHVLQALINKELLVLEARERGLDQSPNVLEELEKFKADRMRDVFHKRMMAQVAISEGEMRRYFEEKGLDAKVEVRARHIVVKTLEEAQEILKELESGGDFAQIATQRSIDQASAKRGGDLGYWEEGVMRGRTAQKIFSMKVGEISEPFESAWGYHIFEILDRRPVGFERQKPEIEKALREQEATQEESRYLEQLTKDLRLEMDQSALELFLDRAAGAADRLPPLSVEDRRRPLVRYHGGRITLGQYADELGAIRPSARPAAGDTRQAVRLAHILARELVLMPEAFRRMGIGQTEEVRSYLAKKREELMVSELRRVAVEEKVITQEAIVTYYRAHLDDYVEEEKITARVAVFKDREDAEQLIEEIRKGAEFGMAESYPSLQDYGTFVFRPSDKRREGIQELVEEILKAETDEIGGPVTLFWGRDERRLEGYGVFEILTKTGARARSLDEHDVVESVKRGLQLEKAKDIETLFEQFLSQLKEKYADRTVVYEKNLSYAKGLRVPLD